VTVLGGFLGAGKTTVLNALLAGDHGVRLGVLVNDFGAIDVDGRLVVGVEGETMTLSNGCVCCSIRDDLLAAVHGMLARPDRPDHLVVETSGVSDPAAVARTFDGLVRAELVRLDGLVAIVDAEQVQRLEGRSKRLALHQVACADWAVLHKADLVTPAQLDAVEAWLRRKIPSVRVMRASRGQIPPALLLGTVADGGAAAGRTAPLDVHVHVRSSQADLAHDPAADDRTDHAHDQGHGHDQGHDHDHDHGHPHDHDDAPHTLVFDSWSWEARGPLSLARLRRALRELPVGVWRAKGVLYLARLPERQVVVHVVGRRVELAPGAPWREPPSERRSSLVVIAERGEFDPDALHAAFERCKLPPRAPAGAWRGAWSWVRERFAGAPAPAD
jgi:G3E family GTPase